MLAGVRPAWVERRRTAVALALAACLSGMSASAAFAQERVYQTNLAEEDWSFLADSSKRTDWWDPVKYIPFGRDGWFMTLAGEVRFRPEGFRIKATDTAPSTRDNYLLQRYLFGADFRFGGRMRAYAEFQSGIINGRTAGPRPTDQNSLDLHQGFVEWRSSRDAKARFSGRLGRQELNIGSSRLISASPTLNTKRSFDGLRVTALGGGWRFEGAAAALTGLQPGIFDDGTNAGIRFWGVAAVRPGQGAKGSWTFYYLGLANRNIQFAQGRGRDERHTLGVGWRAAARIVDFNYDLILQEGNFEGADVSAWGISTETGFRVPAVGWRPRFGLRANGASGDRDAADPSLQSFNPLFPGASFAGPIGLFGATNMIDLTPFVSVMPRRGLILGVERPMYWRTSTADGVYNTALRLLLPPRAGTGHFVGATLGILGIWQATHHLQMSGAVIRLVPGRFLDTTFVRGGAGLYSVTAAYRF
jgi:hypothetical protein